MNNDGLTSPRSVAIGVTRYRCTTPASTSFWTSAA
jgi:hypothetical protein